MKLSSGTCWAVAMLLAANVAHAELPTLNEKDWLGYFVGVPGKDALFGITAKGRGQLRPIGSKGPVSGRDAINVEFVVEEKSADGKAFAHYLLPETLDAGQQPTLKPANVTIRGKVKGDAAIEAYVSEARGAISLGGKMTEPGTLKNAGKYVIQIKFPNMYQSDNVEDKTPGEKKPRDRDPKSAANKFAEKIKDDRMQVTYTDGKHEKIPTDEKLDAATKNGPGITEIEAEFAKFKDKKFQITATPGSVMTLSNENGEALHRGFIITWTVDPAKDPEAKARLNIEVK